MCTLQIKLYYTWIYVEQRKIFSVVGIMWELIMYTPWVNTWLKYPQLNYFHTLLIPEGFYINAMSENFKFKKCKCP